LTIVSPLALLLGLLAVPIVLLYLLKLRRREVEVSSTLLWRMVLADRQANTLWQRLRRNILLLLNLLTLAALVLALADLSQVSPAVTTPSTVVLIDGSASMNAVDVLPSRFEVARRRIEALIETLPSGADMSLVLVRDQPQVLIAGSSHADELRRALRAAAPGQGSANWAAAFSLAASAATSTGRESTIVIASDGGIPSEGLPVLPAAVRYLPVGDDDDNLGIAALAVEVDEEEAGLFVRAANYGSLDHRVLLTLRVDGALWRAEQVDLQAGGTIERSMGGLPSQARVVEARLVRPDNSDQPLDQLPLDDVAYASVAPPMERHALLYPSETAPLRYNLFLEKAMLALANLEPFRAVPADEEGTLGIPSDRFDVYIVDGIVPDPLPDGNLLLVNPGTNALFSMGEAGPVAGPLQMADHPLSRYVDLQSVHVLQARQVDLPDWARPLVLSAEQPLVFFGERDGRRVVVFTFDLHDSDLPLQIAFPILFTGLLDYLAPPLPFDPALNRAPGESVTMVPPLDVDGVAVTTPSGRVEPLEPEESGFVFTDSSELGLYTVTYQPAGVRPPDTFAVNLFDPGESRLTPIAVLPVAQGATSTVAEEAQGWRSLAPWLTGLAAALLTFEWWWYHRGHAAAIGFRASRTG
jgi:hypothetical protein